MERLIRLLKDEGGFLNFLLPALGMLGKGASKVFGKGGIDPTMALLGGLSLFGGEEEKKSFDQEEGIANPRNALRQALEATYRTGQGLSSRGPTKLRSSTVAPPPAPISIPGLPFQIGGGLGRDPALDDASLLEARPNPMSEFDPFQSVDQVSKTRQRSPR